MISGAGYIRPMGAGAFCRRRIDHAASHSATIISALRAGLKDVRAEALANRHPPARGCGVCLTKPRVKTDRDVPMRWVISGSIVIIVMMWCADVSSYARSSTYWYQKTCSPASFVVVFGFFFVTFFCGWRISGLLGNSSNPISGMSIATLMHAPISAAGWTAPNYGRLAGHGSEIGR